MGSDEDGKAVDLLTTTVRLGAGMKREFGSENDDITPEGLLGAEFACRISDRQRLIGATTVYPDLSENGDFRLVSNLDWAIAIDRMDGISLKLGLTHEYQSITDGEIPHNDLAAHAALVVDF